MNRLIIVFLAVLVIATIAIADSNRVLLRPPDHYKGIDIGGVPFVMGEVYLPQVADTALLTSFGFRDFKFAGSSSRYKKIKAWWPLQTEVNDLPGEVIGLTYEKITEKDLAYAAIMQPDMLPSGSNKSELKSIRYSQMHPANGKPHMMYKDQPYVEGEIYCSSGPNEEQLKRLGVILFHDFGHYADDLAVRSGYSRWTAIWPMSLKESQLPYYVAGMIADKPLRYFDEGNSIASYSRQSNRRQSSTTYHNYYGSSSYNLRHYRQPRQRIKYGNDLRTVNWTPAHRNNPNAYWYNTISRTTLTPTTIGAYQGNKSLRKVRTYPRYCR